MSKEAQRRAYDALRNHARLADIVALTRLVTSEILEARSKLAGGAKVRQAADEAKLTDEDAETDFGNAIAVLEREPTTDDERALASAMWVHAIAESPPKGAEAEDKLAAEILWLATHTAFDATLLLDRALGEAAADIWDAIAEYVRRVDAHKISGRGEALVGAAALALSTGERATKHARALGREVTDAALARVFAKSHEISRDDEHLEGEVVDPPRSPYATTALALSGLLFVMHGVRLLARLALAYRRPATVTLTHQSVQIRFRTILLGRTLRERSVVLARDGLIRAGREVRYPNAAFYAGLFALALGSYVGVSTFVDGARAASPSLLMTGFLITAAGIALDFALASVAPGTQGLCRVLFVPRRGPAICIGAVDAGRADAALTKLAAR